MRWMVLGSGAREHAMAFKLSREADTTAVAVCPGNAGVDAPLERVTPPADGVVGMVAAAQAFGADVVIVGPEAPLADGVVDALKAAGIPALGPSAAAAQLEADKVFMKRVCDAAGVPTARWRACTTLAEVDAWLAEVPTATVVKAAGLCAGKGVVVAETPGEARAAAAEMLGEAQDGATAAGGPRFGDASRTVVLEERLSGEEWSVIGLCDGHDVRLFAPTRDHKRLADGDAGPNTGGMGAVGPLATGDVGRAFLARLRKDVFLPVLKAMRHQDTPFTGFLYAGFMVEPAAGQAAVDPSSAVRVLEFNVRFGDPEAQAVFFGTDAAFGPSFAAAAAGKRIARTEEQALAWADAMQPTACVVAAAAGYPEAPQKGDVISGARGPNGDTMVFTAGVAEAGDDLVTAGGRVLCAVATGDTVAAALDAAYARAETLRFAGKQQRADIGQSLR